MALLNADGTPDRSRIAPDGDAGGLRPAASDAVRPAAPAQPPSGLQTLDPRTVALDRVVGAIAGTCIALLYLVVVAGAFLTRAWPWWALWLLASSWVPLVAFLTWLAIKWPEIDYRHRRYRVAADAIEIWSGVLWRHAVIVPRSRVQHIDVSQGPLERSFGLATLTIHTAGTSYSKVDLSGVAHDDALRIRDALLPRNAESAV